MLSTKKTPFRYLLPSILVIAAVMAISAFRVGPGPGSFNHQEEIPREVQSIRSAESARLTGLANRALELRVRSAESARLDGLAKYELAAIESAMRVNKADSERWGAMYKKYSGQAIVQQREIAAEIARWMAMSNFDAAQNKLIRIQKADSDRWTALAMFYDAQGWLDQGQVPLDAMKYQLDKGKKSIVTFRYYRHAR